jgi:hypothetical protein
MSPSALKIYLYYFTNVVEIYALACRGAFTTLFLIFGGCPLSPMCKVMRVGMAKASCESTTLLCPNLTVH